MSLPKELDISKWDARARMVKYRVDSGKGPNSFVLGEIIGFQLRPDADFKAELFLKSKARGGMAGCFTVYATMGPKAEQYSLVFPNPDIDKLLNDRPLKVVKEEPFISDAMDESSQAATPEATEGSALANQSAGDQEVLTAGKSRVRADSARAGAKTT